MSAGSIIIDLLMRTGAFETDVKRAEKSLKQFEKQAYNFGQSIGNAWNLAFTGAGAAVAYFAKQTIDGLDGLNDVADATGASIENISALESVAMRTGASMDQVSSILVKFNAVLNAADDPTKGPGAVLAALGLEAEKLRALDPAEALRQTAVALRGFADDGNKARAVQELFGKSIKDAAPFLNDLAEQTELVGTVTAEQAKQAEEFNKQLFALQATAADLARSALAEMLPALNNIGKAFSESQKAGDSFWDSQIKGYDAWVANFWSKWSDRYTDWYRGFWGMESKGPTGVAFEPSKAGGGRGFVNPEPVKPSLNVPTPPEKAGGGRGGAAKVSEAQRYLDTLTRQLERTRELSTVEQLLTDIQMGRLGAVTEAQQKNLMQLAQEVDAARQRDKFEQVMEGMQRQIAATQNLSVAEQVLRDIQTGRLRDLTVAQQEALMATARQLDASARQREMAMAGLQLTEAMRTAVERVNDAVEQYNELFAEGAINAETLQRAIDDLASSAMPQTVEEAEALAIALAEAGASSEMINKMLNGARMDAGVKQASEMKELMDAQYNLAKAMVESRKESGFFTDLQALRAEGEVNQARIQQLRAYQGQLINNANAIGEWSNKAQAEMLNVEAEIERLSSKIDLVANKFREIFEDAFAQGFEDWLNGTKSFGDALKDVFNNIFKEINKIVARELSQGLMKMLGGGLMPGESQGLFSFLGNIFAPPGVAADAGILSVMGFGGARATGGDVLAGRSYLVGENGPEAFVPRTAGTIIPNKQLEQPKRSGTNIVVNVTATPGMGRDTALQQGQRIGMGIQTAMARNG